MAQRRALGMRNGVNTEQIGIIRNIASSDAIAKVATKSVIIARAAFILLVSN
jgi:hypothetical protein